MLSSSEIIANLQNQIKFYQQTLEQLKNNSDFLAPTLTDSTSALNPIPVPTPDPTSVLTPTSTSTLTPTSFQNIFKPKKRYIKSIDILNLFKFTKAEYNNILVNINKVILNFYFYLFKIFYF
jgi:hypothetical protein